MLVEITKVKEVSYYHLCPLLYNLMDIWLKSVY